MGISATTVSTGLGRGHGGVGIAATHGEAQSLLAKRFAPPKAQSAAGPVGCLAILGFAVAVGAGTALNSAVAFWVVMGLTVVLGIAFARQATAHNAEQLPKAKALWDRRFICLRCEEVFEPQIGSGPVTLQAGRQEVLSSVRMGTEAILVGERDYSVRLISGGDRPLAAMKVVQDLLGLRIREAKQLVETVPQVIRSGLSLTEAEVIKAQFEAIGAISDIVGSPTSDGAGPQEAPGRPLEQGLSAGPSSAAVCCHTCSRPILALDGRCSHCQIEEPADRPVPAWLWAGVALLLIGGVVTYLSSGSSTPGPTQVQAGPRVQAAAVEPQATPPGRTLIAEVTIQAGMLGPLEISGTANLPDGTLLPIWLEGDYPACTPNCGFEMGQATVRNGRFQTAVKGQDPPPGRYTVHITTALASAQPADVGAILGPLGQNLRGSHIAVLADGGKYLPVDPERADAQSYLSGFLVHYSQRIEIGEGGEVAICPNRGSVDDCEARPSGNSGETPAGAHQGERTN